VDYVSFVLSVLYINWGIPFVCSLLYVLWLRYVSRDIVFVSCMRAGVIPALRWRLVSKRSWYAKAWQDWYGVGLFCQIIHRDEADTDDDAYVAETIHHEMRHVLQWVILGLLFPVLYVLHFAWLLVVESLKAAPERHPYLDNWFERDARRAAGQVVDVARGHWPHGPDDLNPWAFNPTEQEVYAARRLWWSSTHHQP
jgi:hypothetical protein